MKYKKSLLICFLAIISCVIFFRYNGYLNKKSNFLSISSNQETAYQENLKVEVPKKLIPVFEPKGIDNIALISMVRNENDVIFDNLIWHFALGFRKFVIVDNKSTDGTRELINQFADLTKDKATVFVIDDPIFEYVQYKMINGAYKFANEIWPEVNWIFPVDADEFWIPIKDLKNILAQIPEIYSSINVVQLLYRPNKEYFQLLENEKTSFYRALPYRTKNGAVNFSKAVVRAHQPNIHISQGNHLIYSRSNSKVASGNLLGLHLAEYTVRSIPQTHKKFSHGMRANLAAKEKGLLGSSAGTHWDDYKYDLEKHGENAAKIKFESFFLDEKDVINDPLPIEEARKIFYKIIDGCTEDCLN